MRIPVVGAALLLLLTGCGQASSSPAPSATAPTPIPASEALETRHPVTVLDEGDGPELCVGAVATSLPPQCGGPRLVGWDWDQHAHEQVEGVRWGSFHVVGHLDPVAATFEVVEVTPWEDWDGEGDRDAGETDLATPCPEPDGGWQVIDPARTTDASMRRVVRQARHLPGYAGSWLDQSPNPRSAAFDDPDRTPTIDDELAMNDPTLTIVNVRVTGDPEAAEADLRRVWGGMLCILPAEHAQADLRGIQDELVDLDVHVGSFVDVVRGRVELSVVHDDGTLQSELDATYGAGVVRVVSQLVPTDSE